MYSLFVQRTYFVQSNKYSEYIIDAASSRSHMTVLCETQRLSNAHADAVDLSDRWPPIDCSRSKKEKKATLWIVL